MKTFTKILFIFISILFSYLAIRDSRGIFEAFLNLIWYNMLVWVLGYHSTIETLKESEKESKKNSCPVCSKGTLKATYQDETFTSKSGKELIVKNFKNFECDSCKETFIDERYMRDYNIEQAFKELDDENT